VPEHLRAIQGHKATELSEVIMKKLVITILLLAVIPPVFAGESQRVIVRNNNGAPAMQAVCQLLGCSVLRQLDGTLGKLFLIRPPKLLSLQQFLLVLGNLTGIVHVELDVSILLEQPAVVGQIPAGLWDRNPVQYFGSSVWNGYSNQPAAEVVRLAAARSQFGATGAGTVAVIDTGISTRHPALVPVIVPGYDFTRDVAGIPEEEGDVQQSTAAVLDDAEPGIVSQSTAAVLDEESLGILSAPDYAAFGHGTMVSGVIHLVAPTARIMPLKAFRADGTGNLSDILRAIYFAVDKRTDVINMSFSFTYHSEELQRALENARNRGAIAVAAAGNYGTANPVYPAGYTSVMAVASTDNWDRRSSFSNYGPFIWVAAPGEAIISTYPFGSYSASWGTSFSAPMVAGAVALLLDGGTPPGPDQAAEAIGYARWISSELGHGRLDIYRAVEAWRLNLSR
jgi:subtilisin family serine protease